MFGRIHGVILRNRLYITTEIILPHEFATNTRCSAAPLNQCKIKNMWFIHDVLLVWHWDDLDMTFPWPWCGIPVECHPNPCHHLHSVGVILSLVESQSFGLNFPIFALYMGCFGHCMTVWADIRAKFRGTTLQPLILPPESFYMSPATLYSSYNPCKWYRCLQIFLKNAK